MKELAVLVVLLAACLVLVVAAARKIDSLKTEAIELGYAQHNAKTGVWEWIQPKTQ